VAFEIEEHDHRRSMRDPVDGTAFSLLARPAMDMSDGVFRLDWQGYRVPLFAEYDRFTSAPRIIVTITSIGEVPVFPSIQRTHPDLVDTVFAPGDRERCTSKAVEALVVFGAIYDGLNYPDGKFTVHVPDGPNTGSYTLSSFGYRGAGRLPEPDPDRSAVEVRQPRRRWWQRRLRRSR
jgi:hypothetical protein